MAGFNSKHIRNANRVSLSGAGKDFTAYLIGGFEFGFSAKLGSLFGDVSTINDTYNRLASVANFAIDRAGGKMLPVGVDIPRKALYGGSSPVKLNLRTFLPIEESYDKDIRQPLLTLMEWTLPTSADSILIEELKAQTASEVETGNEGWKIAQRLFQLAEEYLGEIRKLIPPKALNDTLTLTIGDPPLYTIREVLLMDFRAKLPSFLYTDEGKAVPSHIEIDLNVETMRVASVGMIDF